MSRHAELNGQPSGERRRSLRWLVRSVCLVAAIGALWPAVEGAGLPGIVPALSPFVAVASLLATRTFHALAGPGLAVGLLVLLRHRWFCRWICPLGLCADGASRLGRHLGRRSKTAPPLGQWIVWLTLAGACLGTPLLLWLDPLAIFTSLFGFGGPDSGFLLWRYALPVAAVLMLSLLWPHAWCGSVCPLGAFQDLSSRLAHCVRRTAGRAESDPPSRCWNRPLTRRTVLGAAVGVASASVLRRTHASASRPLRPPGAVDEPKFVGVCIRCGNCIRACPTRIIESDRGRHGLASLLTPVLRFRDGYCLENCTRCTEVCPSGAIVALSLKDKANVPLGLPKVDMNVCLLGDDRECAECRNWCPHDAIRYVFSEVEYTLTPQIDARKCTGCGACEVACPTAPKKAIVVVPCATRSFTSAPKG